MLEYFLAGRISVDQQYRCPLATRTYEGDGVPIDKDRPFVR